MAEGKDLKPDADAKAERDGELQADDAAGKGNGKKKTGLFLVIIVVALIVLGAGGYFVYNLMLHGKKDGGAGIEVGRKEAKTALFALDPFVVNLSEPGRYLKVTMQFELSSSADEKYITERVPILRDVIITLIGNQTYEYAASAEGKIQLKEEILLRTNRIFGKEVFRNLYFTEFVMQ
jgi:flagellar FliL protein